MPWVKVNSDPPKPITFEDLGYVQVVRCKDCRFAYYEEGIVQEGHIFCTKPGTESWQAVKPDDWFCADGSRKE